MLQNKVLICKLVSIDRSSASSIVIGKVSTLAHKAWDNSVEARAFVTISIFSSAQLKKVFTGLWTNIKSQLNNDAAQRGAVAGDVKENPLICHCNEPANEQSSPIALL